MAQRRPGLRLGVVVVPLVFAAVIAASVAAGLFATASDSPDTGPAPRALAGHELEAVMVGPEALAEINDLHGKNIADVLDGWVGHYHDGGTVWVAAAPSEATAQMLLDDMVQGIERDGSPFSGLAEAAYEGQTVFRVTDGNQYHFFYQQGLKVIWLAAPRGSEDDFLAAAFSEIS